jgi:hypothetical protein
MSNRGERSKEVRLIESSALSVRVVPFKLTSKYGWLSFVGDRCLQRQKIVTNAKEPKQNRDGCSSTA